MVLLPMSFATTHQSGELFGDWDLDRCDDDELDPHNGSESDAGDRDLDRCDNELDPHNGSESDAGDRAELGSDNF